MTSPKTISFYAYRGTSAANWSIFKGGPVRFIATLDPSIDLTGCTSLRLDIRESVTDIDSPLATDSITNPSGTQFEFVFSSGETNHDLTSAWLVLSAYFPEGVGSSDDNLDPLYIAGLTIVPHNASLLAPSPPNAAVALTQDQADALYLPNTGQSGILIGRYSSGTGALQFITLGANLSLTTGGVLVAGAGGSVSWGAIGGTITDQSDLLIFRTIAAAGQSSIVADSATDTLTVTGAGNISIYTDASTDTLIISGSGGGGSSYTDEMAQDAVFGAFQNGTGISWSYNDAAGTFSGNVSLSAFSTTNLSEGSNLYFTEERAQDTIGGIFVTSPTISLTYNDSTPYISGDVRSGSITFDKFQGLNSGSLVGRYSPGSGVAQEITLGGGLSLSAGGILSASVTGAASVSWGNIIGTLSNQTDLQSALDAKSNTGHTHVIADITDATEGIQDVVGAFIRNGTGIAWTYNDSSNYLSGDVSLSSFSTTNLSEGSNQYYTDERVDDRVAALIKNGTGIIWTYNDTAGTLSGDISLSSFIGNTVQAWDATLDAFAAYNTNGLLTQTAANTFVGRTLTGTADEITITNGNGVAGNPTASIPSFFNLSSKTGFSIPTGSAPTVDSNGKIALDTSVTDFSHGIIKYYGGEELGLVAMPISQFTSPSDNYVIKYNASADEFQLGSGVLSQLTLSNLGTTTSLVANTLYTGTITGRTVTLPSATNQDVITYRGIAANDTTIVWPSNTVLQVGASGYASSTNFLSGYNVEFSLAYAAPYWFLADSSGSGSFTDENAQDAVGSIFATSPTINFTYNDASPYISGDVRSGSITFDKIQGINSGSLLGRYSPGSGNTQEITLGGGLVLSAAGVLSASLSGAASVAWGNITGTLSNQSDLQAALDAKSNVGHTHTISDITDATEGIQDVVGAFIRNGTGLAWTYNDSSNYLSGDVSLSSFSTTNLSEGSNLYFTNERAQDAVGGALQNGTGFVFTYNDAGNYISGDVSLSAFSTTNLSEGSNLYYTDERVDDRVSALIKNGTGIAWSYNDTAGTLSGDVSLSSFSTTNLAEGSNLYFTNERAQDAVGSVLQNGSGLFFTYNDASNYISGDVSLSPFTTTNLAEGSNLYYTDERAQDYIGGNLRNGTGFTFTYNDASNYISGDVSLSPFSTTNLSEGANLYYTDERVDDRVSSLIKNGTGINWTYNDSAGTLSGDITLSPFIGSSVQAWDSTLDALAAYNTNGLLTQTAANTFTGRSIAGTTNEITLTNGDGVAGNPTASIPDWFNLSSKTGFSVPTGAAPILDRDGKFALDTSVTDWSHGILKYYGGEELGIVAMPLAQFTSPTNDYVVKYNAAADEFQLAADVSGSGVAASDESSVYESITQTSHGFTTGNALRFGTGIWIKALANNISTASALGIVQSVADANTFSLVYAGRISTLTGLSTGVAYYLSPTTSGALTTVEPEYPNISKPMLWATSYSGGIVLSHRPVTGVNTSCNGSFGLTIDGAGSTILTGQKGYLSIPYNCIIKNITLLSDISGSLSLDIWNDSYGNYPPTVADSIVGGTYPAISSGIKYTDSVLAGWSTSVTGSNVLGFNVVACSGITRLNATLGIIR